MQGREKQAKNGEKTDENPFKKGPKLHLFKKSRRLKTSSAVRQQSDEEMQDQEGNQVDEQTITTGIMKTQKQLPSQKNGLETNNTTLNSASQQSHVYGTIEQTRDQKEPGLGQMKKLPSGKIIFANASLSTAMLRSLAG